MPSSSLPPPSFHTASMSGQVVFCGAVLTANRMPPILPNLVLDLGHFVRPVITPDDTDAVEAAIRAQTHLEPTGNGKAPIM
jgi:hypothetical protein